MDADALRSLGGSDDDHEVTALEKLESLNASGFTQHMAQMIASQAGEGGHVDDYLATQSKDDLFCTADSSLR